MSDMPEIHAERRRALRAELVDIELDAILVTELTNIRYLTGFTGSHAALLVGVEGETATVFATDGRYTTQAAEEVPDLEVVVERGSARVLAKHAADEPARYGRLGFESQHVSVEQHDVLAEATGAAVLQRAPHIVERLRSVKSDSEIESLRAACTVADRALAGLVAAGGLRQGRTEREVARELESRMFDHGAAAVAFETIVASGENSAVPHHTPGDRKLVSGDFVKIDFGATVAGYNSDMTRMFVLGEPAEWQRELYELVQRAQQSGYRAVRPGNEVTAVDAAAREVVEESGRGEQFPHGLGHGVGLRVHEAPSLGKGGTGSLASGMVVTVEPGVYLAGYGGVRIEDTVVVRDGAAEVLTISSRELLVV